MGPIQTVERFLAEARRAETAAGDRNGDGDPRRRRPRPVLAALPSRGHSNGISIFYDGGSAVAFTAVAGYRSHLGCSVRSIAAAAMRLKLGDVGTRYTVTAIAHIGAH
jgi:hypothetical protein